MAFISDARLSGRSDAAVIAERLLSITGEDALTIDQKYLAPRTLQLLTRLVLMTNEMPKLSDASGALANRWIILRLTESFLGREDTGLTDKLMVELPGILLWAIEGLRRLRARGHFVQPTAGQEAIDELMELSSPITSFVREWCVVDHRVQLPALHHQAGSTLLQAVRLDEALCVRPLPRFLICNASNASGFRQPHYFVQRVVGRASHRGACGRIRHKAELYDGEHEAIVDPSIYAQVQGLLAQNGRSGGVEARNRHGALLRRMLYCKACGQAMAHTFTSKRGRQYRYYTCVRAIKSGRAACPAQSLPAAEIERVVIDQVQCIGRDAGLLAEVMVSARAHVDAALASLHKERTDLVRELARHHAEVQRLAVGAGGRSGSNRLAELHDLINRAERRLPELETQVTQLERERVTDADVRAAFTDFANVWGQLSPKEQARLLALLVARVEFDAGAGTVAVTFHPTGIRALSGRTLEEAA